MAEQVSHNVVNNSESASASALADVAANQTTIASAADGTESTLATNSDAFSTNGKAEAAIAEPSAGDASTAAEAPALPHTKTADDSEKVDASVLANGVSHGEDGSVNSDTEGSRADGTEQKKEGNHHVRTNSVKKPTTFSKVSVTKNFMAKTASPGPQAAKIGDKPSPLSTAPQPVAFSARPRLVAKTGAMQTTLKSRAGPESAGPDASKVWNKNRRTSLHACLVRLTEC